VIEKYRYDVFGNPITIYSAGIYNNRFKFTGREFNSTFGFYEYRARAYHPILGRFMSEDPKLFDPGDYNLFRYCHNDPMDFTDPMGTVTDTRQEEPWFTHTQQAEAIDRAYGKMMADAQWSNSGAISAGMAGYQAWSALSNPVGQSFHMGYMSQSQQAYTYSLKSQYNIGDLSGARGFYYVWDSDPGCSGQCMTTVQHLSGAPSSNTPLIRGNPVGPNTKQRTAIATGFEPRNGQWVYPSKPANLSNNHAAFYVAPLGRGIMQTLEAQKGVPLHLGKQATSGWYEVTSRLPPVSTSTSELRSWTGPVPW
jgi:RHS repeat-associated core domain